MSQVFGSDEVLSQKLHYTQCLKIKIKLSINFLCLGVVKALCVSMLFSPSVQSLKAPVYIQC